MIKPLTYGVICEHCRWVIRAVTTLEEAQEIERTVRDCIVANGRVYCCEECREKGEAAR